MVPDPPVAVIVAEYGKDCVAVGRVVVTIVTGGLMVIVSACVSTLPMLSSTRTVKLNVPVAVGVPVIALDGVPEGASARPAGRVPVIDHW